MKTRVFIRFLAAIVVCQLHSTYVRSQTYPSQMMDQSYIPSSPNAQTFQVTGNDPVALSNGSQAINIPIYTVTCGSLRLPISLSYNYTGLFPLQDAGWVGLGWTLNAGGTISRTIEGDADGTELTGLNYGQYNLRDSTEANFANSGHDLAPDIFSCVVNGMSDQFFNYNGRAYQLEYDKQFGINWSSTGDSVTVTTTDGTTYLFATTEITTATIYHFSTPTALSYNSAWQLSQVISADRKDTIVLTYAPYTWQQASVSYQSTYAVAVGEQASFGADPTVYNVNPSIQAQVLQSITCRTSRVSFVPDAALRTDVNGSYPRLREIDIVDSLTGKLVKKNTFSYGYFGLTTNNPQNVEHLKLKTFASWNTASSTDTLTHRFSYIGENAAMPQKNTNGIDDWGYYNGQDNNGSLLPQGNDPYYDGTPSINFSNNRTPSLAYCSYGALDTIVYPTGMNTAFTYAANSYLNAGSLLSAPGICITSALDFSPGAATPLIARYYSYTGDATGQSSGVVINPPRYIKTLYVYSYTNSQTHGNYLYDVYQALSNSSGIGGAPPLFYYQEVSEQISSSNETHKSSYYFANYNPLFSDVQLLQKVDYINPPGTNSFTILKSTSTNYAFTQDSSFIAFKPSCSGQTINSTVKPPVNELNYGVAGRRINTYWLRPVSTQTIIYDSSGNSLTTTAAYTYNAVTRNLSLVQQTTSDGQTLTTKFKYPEDYVTALTGNMVAARVISPILEKEVWLKQDASDSVLISGQVSQYDQTIFKPTATYTLQTTTPIPALNNETTSNGLYSSLLSTSQYTLLNQTQFDGNANISTVNQASDIPTSFIWDYRHTVPIAQVNNAGQADIAYSSFEADGSGNWVFSGLATVDPTAPTGNNCYNASQPGGIAKTGLTPSMTYVVSYWIKGTSSLSIAGTVSGYPIQGKTINGWTYFEHKINGQSAVNISGNSYIDELRLYPANAQMKTYTYTPLIGKSGEYDADGRATYYRYDGFGRLHVLLDQDHNIIKTYQYHYQGQ